MNSARIKIKDEGRLKIFCFIVFFIAIMFTQDKLLFSQNYSNTQAVVVSRGDSLWNIASKYKNENEDTRRFINKIQEINFLNTSELIEGQEIKIPTYSKK
jgi:nucleoid-associated protein YgaU